MSMESDIERLKWEASDERKKAFHASNLKRTERQERVVILEGALQECIRARDQIVNKTRRLADSVRNDPRIGSTVIDQERLEKILDTNPTVRQLKEKIVFIEDELAALRREGLPRLVRAIESSEEEHPLRRAVLDGEGSQALRRLASMASSKRGFLSDGDLREVEALMAGAAGAEGARIRRVAAALLRDFSQTIVEAAKHPV
jgi:hypothetical protein